MTQREPVVVERGNGGLAIAAVAIIVLVIVALVAVLAFTGWNLFGRTDTNDDDAILPTLMPPTEMPLPTLPPPMSRLAPHYSYGSAGAVT